MRNAEEDMAEQAPDRVWSVNIPKTIAGALAAVCAAVVGSYLGVAGTLIGAAVASIIGTVGTEVYERSITRGGKKLQTLAAPVFIKAPAAVGTPPVAAATEEDSPSHTVPPKQQINWRRVSLVAAAAFVLAMGSLTVVELLAHRSVASMVGNGTKAGSTVGGLLDPGTGSSTPTPTPSTSPSVSPTETTAPGVAPTTTAPASPAPAATTTPTTAPTTEPTTVAPTTDAPPNNP
jgi:hypothetical protein